MMPQNRTADDITDNGGDDNVVKADGYKQEEFVRELLLLLVNHSAYVQVVCSLTHLVVFFFCIHNY